MRLDKARLLCRCYARRLAESACKNSYETVETRAMWNTYEINSCANLSSFIDRITEFYYFMFSYLYIIYILLLLYYYIYFIILFYYYCIILFVLSLLLYYIILLYCIILLDVTDVDLNYCITYIKGLSICFHLVRDIIFTSLVNKCYVTLMNLFLNFLNFIN